MLPLVNRSAILLTPRQPFLDWADAVYGDGARYLDIVSVHREDARTIFLGPDGDLTGDPHRFITRNWSLLFETLLSDWCQDESTWPQDRSLRMFRQWFDVTVFGVVLDALKQPLEAV